MCILELALCIYANVYMCGCVFVSVCMYACCIILLSYYNARWTDEWTNDWTDEVNDWMNERIKVQTNDLYCMIYKRTKHKDTTSSYFDISVASIYQILTGNQGLTWKWYESDMKMISSAHCIYKRLHASSLGSCRSDTKKRMCRGFTRDPHHCVIQHPTEEYIFAVNSGIISFQGHNRSCQCPV